MAAKTARIVNDEFTAAIFDPIVGGLGSEMDAGFLASLFKCFADSLKTLGGQSALSAATEEAFFTATQNQLHTLATRRQARSERIHGSDWAEEQEDMLLMEEMEGFALEEMQKALEIIDPQSSLIVAVGSVKALHIPHAYESDSYE